MTPIVRLARVGRRYQGPPEVRALLSVNLSVDSGEYVTVIGRSGSGKSTLLNIAGLLDRPTEGTYEFDGIDVSGLNDKCRTAIRGSSIGFVFQAFHLMPHRSALENVALAQLYCGVSNSERTQAAQQALARVGLAHRATALARNLSGGEQQRVAIARSIVHHPTLILCDEPTGNLDTATAREVLGLLDDLHSVGITLMVITHDPNVAARGERTVAIRDGRLS